MRFMNNVKDVAVKSARVVVREVYEAGSIEGTWRINLEKFFRVTNGTVIIL